MLRRVCRARTASGPESRRRPNAARAAVDAENLLHRLSPCLARTSPGLLAWKMVVGQVRWVGAENCPQCPIRWTMRPRCRTSTISISSPRWSITAASRRRAGRWACRRSKLSRRIGLLEERLGVRLIQRSTRRFAVTEIGQEYYRHCVAMLVEADAAQEAIERTRAEPQGLVRRELPVGVAATSRSARCWPASWRRNPRVEIASGKHQPPRRRDRRRVRPRDPGALSAARGERSGDEGAGRQPATPGGEPGS